MAPRMCCCLGLAVLFGPFVLAQEPVAQARVAPDLRHLLAAVPDEAVVVLCAPAPEHGLRVLASTLGPIPPGLPAEVVAKVGAGLAFVQAGLRGSIAETAALLAGGGLVVGILPPSSGCRLVAVSQPPDPEVALRWCQRFPARLHAGRSGSLLLVSDTAAGLQLLQERASAAPGRWATFDFGPGEAMGIVRAAADLPAVRAWLGDRAPDVQRLDGGERYAWLPIVHAFAVADWLRIELVADGERHVTLLARADASVLGSELGGLLTGGGATRTIVPLAADGLALLSLDRCLHTMFHDLERYLPPADVLAAQGFLAIADALDGARSSFVDDLLGGLREPFVLHVLPAAGGEPDDERAPLVVPEFALVAAIEDPQAEAVVLRLAQVFSTIVNAERSQRGQSTFRWRRVRDEDGTRLLGEPSPWRGPGLPPVDRQLSPVVWCGHGVVVLASTASAAQRIVERASTAAQDVRGDVLELRGPAIGRALAANRQVLALARMLDEGKDPVMANRFFAVAEVLAAAVRRLAVRCEVAAAATEVHVLLERHR